jgi:hypothetical protein
LILEVRPGDTLRLEVYRDRRKIEIAIPLEKMRMQF